MKGKIIFWAYSGCFYIRGLETLINCRVCSTLLPEYNITTAASNGQAIIAIDYIAVFYKYIRSGGTETYHKKEDNV